jgi:Ni2+-binding GTPase involved in maturation of urease and hydrogenase
MPYFDFDLKLVEQYAHHAQSQAQDLPALRPDRRGLREWIDWLRENVKAWNK